MRVLLGLLAQPFAAAAAAFLLFPALDYTGRAAGIHRGRLSDDAAISFAVAAALAAVAVVVFGALPAIGWLSRRGPIALRASLIAGALLGNAPSAFILLLAAVNGDMKPWTVRGARSRARDRVRQLRWSGLRRSVLGDHSFRNE